MEDGKIKALFKQINRKRYVRKKIYKSKKKGLIRDSYKGIIEIAHTWLGTISPPCSREDQIMLLDYMIDSILNDICSSVIVDAFTEQIDRRLVHAFPGKYYDEEGNGHEISTGRKVTVDLSVTKIYVRPWRRIPQGSDMLRILHKNEFKYFKLNHMTKFYTDVNICCAQQGHHSLNAGRYFKKGKILSEEQDLPQLYPHVRTDGYNWYNIHTGKRLDKVDDFRFAAVYTLAKMRNKIRHTSGEGAVDISNIN